MSGIRSSPQGAFCLSFPPEALIGQRVSSVALDHRMPSRALPSGFGFIALQEGWA